MGGKEEEGREGGREGGGTGADYMEGNKRHTSPSSWLRINLKTELYEHCFFWRAE